MASLGQSLLRIVGAEPLLGRVPGFVPKIERTTVSASLSQEEAILASEAFAFQVSIQLEDRTHVWVISRTLREFSDLHDSFAEPKPPFTATASQSPETQYCELEKYMEAVERLPELYMKDVFLDFVEVSRISFSGKSQKRKEGYVFKRTGGYKASDTHCCDISRYVRRMQKRWLVLQDDSLGYLVRPNDSKLHEYMSFRGGIKAELARDSGFQDAVLVASSTRNFFFRTGDKRSALEWVRQIREAFEQCEWSRGDNRFMSSFPIRHGNMAKWYVDGEEYFADVYRALQGARSTVYITDWWLSPELYLDRTDKTHSQVMEVLRMLASRQPPVSIFVHVYKEVSFALTLNSYHTEEVLRSLHKDRVKVIRHPHRSVVGSQFLWSHHEKMVVIDSRKAFIGGLDLCFGRWDTNKHLLTDKKVSAESLWPGIDYSNCRIADFTEVENWERDSISRETNPRMPWHDIAVMVTGPVACDIARHFTELWNFVQTDITANYRKAKLFLQPAIPSRRGSAMRSFVDERRNALMSRTQSVFRPNEVSRIDISHLLLAKEVKTSVQEAISISKLERAGHPAILENEEQEVQVRKNFLPRSTTTRSFRDPQASFLHSESLEIEEETKEKKEIEEDSKQGPEQLERRFLRPDRWMEGSAGRCECQVVVSNGLWSYGVGREDSIHVAYLELIGIASHFIYVENQFFISSTAGEPVLNTIAEALVLRISYAHEHRQPFKVIVVMPLLPAFEGSVTDPAAKVLRVQLHWEYATISRGRNSVFQQLRSKYRIEDPSQFISFYGLRTHAMMDRPVTEIVYVHSKVLIVDDKYALIGSANINDRSMLGDRDSEVAMVIQDTREIPSVLAQQKVMVSEFAHSLRMRIFQEHFGESDTELLRDPVSPAFSAFAKERADTNTEVYRELFACYPDDQIARIDQVRERNPSPEEYEALSNRIKGFIVHFPLNFLCEVDLGIPVLSPEYLIPQESFV